MTDLLLNPRTKTAIDNFLKQPSHGLLLIGPVGAGKRTVAEHIGAGLLDLRSTADLQKYPYYTCVELAESQKDISIDAARSIIRAGRLKIPGRQSIRRVILIDGAHQLSLPAQNALLKSLEEPAEDTVFVLTAPSVNSVLPTIASRLWQLDVGPVSLAAARRYYAEQHRESRVEAAWRLSRGQAGLLRALLTDDRRHVLKQAVEEAKILVQQSPYELVATLEVMAKDRQRLGLMLDALDRVITALHHAAIAKNQPRQATSLLAKRRLIRRLQTADQVNASQRLLVLELALNLGG